MVAQVALAFALAASGVRADGTTFAGRVFGAAPAPALAALLDHPDAVVRWRACGVLKARGAEARAVLPALVAGVDGDRLGTAGWGALAAVAGADAAPVILAAVERGRLRADAPFAASVVFSELPDPRAAGFMARMLADGSRPDNQVRGAMFFARLGDAPSLARLRLCLRHLPPGDTGPGSDSLPDGTFAGAAAVRRVAVEELGRRRDAESFAPILAMLSADPSVNVRTAAARALGDYADARAVPALAAAFGQKDDGFGSQGHSDGDLRRACVRALGKVESDAAIGALFHGLVGGPAAPQCTEFWFGLRDGKHFAAFLRLSDARPIRPDLAAGILDYLARLAGGGPRLPPANQADAEAEFLAAVDDPAHFGSGVDLTKNGHYEVRTTFTFTAVGFARVDFYLHEAKPLGYGHGYGVLYRKVGNAWLLVGRVGGWVS